MMISTKQKSPWLGPEMPMALSSAVELIKERCQLFSQRDHQENKRCEDQTAA